jgi:hypothetical protein
MNVERLTILADMLDTVPETRFDLREWKCGTTACAVGWACSNKQLQEQGLSYDDAPTYDGVRGWRAVDKFFEFAGPPIGGATKKGTTKIAVRLFDADSYPDHATPKMVAMRIREVIQAGMR